MKVRIVTTPGSPVPTTGDLASYLYRKFGIVASFDIQASPIAVVTHAGLNANFPAAVGGDATSYVDAFGDCDWLIVCWPFPGLSIATSGYVPDRGIILTSMPLFSANDFYREASHEDYHGFWAYLGLHGVQSQDTMDVNLGDEQYSHEMEIEHPQGNRERNLAAMQPYLTQLRARYNAPTAPIAPPASSGLLAALRALLARLTVAVAQKEVKTPVGLAGIIQIFGNATDPGFAAKYLVSTKLPYPLKYLGVPVTTIQCHRLAAPNIVNALSELETLGLQSYVQNYGGCYNLRPKRTNGTELSTHSWGIALDLEPQEFPLGATARFPREVVAVFTKHGFTCGETFPTSDSGHFQVCSGY